MSVLEIGLFLPKTLSGSVLGEGLCIFIGDPTREVGSLKGNFKMTKYGFERKTWKKMAAACEHCRKEETDPKHKMQVCAKCKTFGRYMPYCSRLVCFFISFHFFPTHCCRECVKADWPRHKTICGKPFTEETATSTAVVVNPATGHGQAPTIIPPFTPALRGSRQCSIRPCTGGYKRSAALIRQVLLLQQNPAVDYFLCLPSTTNNLVSITLPDDVISARFCAARDDVMSTGSVESLGHIVQILLQASRSLISAGKYREEYLISQIQKEYGMEMTSSG